MYDAIDLYSLIRSEFNQTYNKTLDSLNFYNEISVDSLSFFKENSGASDYKLYIRDENTRISKVDKDSNYHKVDTVKLNFNKTYKVFCNTMATLKGPYLVEDRFGSTKEKQFAQNIYPAIRLSNFEYYYIEGSWHLKGHENYLTKVSIDCR